ncbi:MAG: ArsR family transcriptional regulator [Balneolaceae bacterium]|nr:MAG: ArsR family transcriptional regulator [Balneolaceae bacterium]
MNVREFKNKIYSELASITKALANPHRLEIIELLAQGPSSVEYIVDNTNLTVANASQHLQTLKSARLVRSERRGKYSYYSLASPKVFEVWETMRELGFSQNAEIGKLMKEFRESRHNLESMTSSQLLERMQQGKALLLDVRPREEYESGHIASAISIPSDELFEKLKELPKDKEIVAYCRGPLCAMAYDAVELLNKHGFKAVRLETGFPEWEVKGLPVEQ